jgi:hypothetical protein
MRRSKFVFVLVVIGLFLFGGLVSGFQGSSSSYSSDNRADSFSEKDASSSSFTQRLIGGIQVVGEYIAGAFEGRFGILGVDKSLIINITSHQDLDEVVRGNDAVAGEDDKGSVPDFINFTAQVYDNATSSGFSGASCYFYDNGDLFGNTTTNASGHCFVNWTKVSFDVGFRNISINYSIETNDTKVVAVSEVNISLVRYVSTLTMGNLRSSGCASGVGNCYHHGDNATLSVSIVKINSSGTVSYDPQNISANATNAAESVYTGGSFFYPHTDGNLVRTGEGEYEVNVTVDKTFGSQVRWDVLVSDSNFSDFISTAVHADAAICAGDFGAWSAWGECNGIVETRSRTDSSDCTEVETQSCTEEDGGGGCIPSWGDWGNWSECSNDEETRTRSNGCGSTETQINKPCGCVPNWQCSGFGECVEPGLEVNLSDVEGSYRKCIRFIDLNNCGVDVDESMEEYKSCDLNLFEEYFPQNRVLTIANNSVVDFSAEIRKESLDLISVGWNVDGVFRKLDSEVGELVSLFEFEFDRDSVVVVDVGIGDFNKIETWEIRIDLDIEEDCEEAWICDWTRCDESNLKFAESCVDGNKCESNKNQPIRKTCDCVPDYDCGDWGECNVDYDLTDILRGEQTFGGVRERQCEEVVGCVDEDEFITQEQECSLAVDVRVERTEWCFEEYIEIYDIATDDLVSRVKERNVENIKRVDIGFLTTEFGSVCGYCFDHIENYDERGVDCGGQVCQECVETGLFFDYLYFGRFSIWLLLLLALAYSAYKYREETIFVSKERVLAKLIEPKSKRFASRFRFNLISKLLSRFRLPKIFRSKAVKVKRLYAPEPKPRRLGIAKPYAGLRSKLRAWKKKGYYETGVLEKNLTKAIRESGHQHRLTKERKRIEKERLVHERKLAKFRKKAESERVREVRKINRKSRKPLFAFLFSKHKKVKSKRLERKEQRRRLKREKRQLVLEKRRQRRIRKVEIKRRNERQKVERIQKRKLKNNLRKVRRKKIGTIIKALFVSYQHRRAKKKLSRHHEKAHKKQVKHEKKDRRKLIKRKKRLFKLKRREERKYRKKEKHRVKKEVKLIKRRIRKKQVSKTEFSDLRRKLGEWQRKGYYSTTRLQKKLDKHEDKDPLS